MSANAIHKGDGGELTSDKFVDATGCYQSNAEECEATKYPLLGPAFFVATLIALIVFFTWFLRA